MTRGRPLRAVEDDDAASTHALTIEQLAHETGMSVRNIRNHQSRGLLPPPEVRARTGYYGPRHVERLRLIQEMQSEGLKLSAIQRLLGDGESWAERFIGLRRAITAPHASESAEIVSEEELTERFGPIERNDKSLAKALKLGILVPLGDGRYEVPSPALLRAAEEVVERGVPLPAALAVIEKARRGAESTARAFVRLFMEELWKPFDEAGRPAERWPEITESIERLRPLAAEAMLAVFKQTMAEEVEDAFGKLLEEQARRKS
jgi:DNA-binding transcriptional MerR regulator